MTITSPADNQTDIRADDQNQNQIQTPTPTTMQVTKRNGTKEPVDVMKIVRAISRCVGDLDSVDPMKIATKTIAGLYDGATTAALDQLSIQTAAGLIIEEPQYSRVAARLLSAYIDKEVEGQEIYSFSQSVGMGYKLGLINERLFSAVAGDSRKLNDAIDRSRDARFEYFGLRTLYDRYLIKHPTSRKVIETPQQFFMRVAVAVTESAADAIDLYRLFSSHKYMTSSPTLFNAGMKREQLSSCFILDSPPDTLTGIYDRYKDIALLSKFAGGIGLPYTKVRSRGSLISATNGHSDGIVPWLRTLDASVAAVNQGGKRKGAACVYLEPWHKDIEEFLELRDGTGDIMRRTHNLELALWIPDEFMHRVEKDEIWSLFDPKEVQDLPECWGDEWTDKYIYSEQAGLAKKVVKARDLYAKMMRCLAQTGNGWMTFKDKANRASNQTADYRNVIHSSNLCTEIMEVTPAGETAVCNLGSINLGEHMQKDGAGKWYFDFDELVITTRRAVRQLDRVIDITNYPIESARESNLRWRPVGLGIMGLQDVFFKMRMPFDCELARGISKKISETIYYHALSQSCDLAYQLGAHPSFKETRAAGGELQFDAWDVSPSGSFDWDVLQKAIVSSGLRNSLLIAIAPTATIASISGCYECIEPQVSNLFKRETMSGDFLQVNKYLVQELKNLNLWTEEIRDQIKANEGSIQGIEQIPGLIQEIYRTAWEIPMQSLIDMAADRGAFIDQSQSLNLFQESPTIGKLSSMYFYAWKKGLKSTYYLRSRPATRIMKTTISSRTGVLEFDEANPPLVSGDVLSLTITSTGEQADIDAVTCSLENPETCEACS